MNKFKAGDKVRIKKMSVDKAKNILGVFPGFSPDMESMLGKEEVIIYSKFENNKQIYKLSGGYSWVESMLELVDEKVNIPSTKPISHTSKWKGSYNMPFDPDVDDYNDIYWARH